MRPVLVETAFAPTCVAISPNPSLVDASVKKKKRGRWCCNLLDSPRETGGMALECGRHKCASSCHKHLPNEQFVLRCDQLCARPLDCEHPCQKQVSVFFSLWVFFFLNLNKCHTGVCPAVVCEQKATIRCECGRLSKAIVCGLKHSDPEQQKVFFKKTKFWFCPFRLSETSPGGACRASCASL